MLPWKIDLILTLLYDCKRASIEIFTEEAVETFLELIEETLEKGEDVTLSGFGKWQVRHKNARRGRNPQTGEKLIIEPRKVVTFSLSKILRDKLDGRK